MSTLLKFSYILPDGKKINGYLKDSSPSFTNIQERIVQTLFEERKEERCEIRYYWIDEDGDEIDIVSQDSFNIFWEIGGRRHLYVAPKNNAQPAVVTKSQDATATTTKATPPTAETTNPTANAAGAQSTSVPPQPEVTFDANQIHMGVECDSCLMAPIIGFRYKCIQCPNYDLCQHCEAKHVHGDHMMIRMPNNSCPFVVDAWVTPGLGGCGRKLGRKHHHHEKRWKSAAAAGSPSCSSAAAGATSNGEGEKPKESGRKHGRRHARHNFLSHLYEMMHDLAEGGGAAAAAAASAGGSACTPETSDNTTKIPTTENVDHEAIAKAAAEAANLAAQKAHETAVKSAEIAAKVIQETTMAAAAASKEASPSPSTTTTSVDNEKPTTSKSSTPNNSAQATPTMSATPSLQDFVQLLDPKLLKGGMEILNNFNDMFAKMLDPMDGAEGGDATACPFAANFRRPSNTSSQHSNTNSMNSSKTTTSSKSETDAAAAAEPKKTSQEEAAVTNGLLDISDVGSDSESDSVSESFIKLNAPSSKEASPEAASAAASIPSAGPSSATTTPPQSSLNKSNVMDFAQISADLKAHIDKMETEERKEGAANEVPKELRAVPVFNKETEKETSAVTKKPEEKRSVPVYHQDELINSSVHAMMAMGFSNEGAWLTQLLESVNGNIPEALDLISASQRMGR
ncbi:protein ref(2)P-like [Musca vetustissima]|uniref:protein ref(2)P-like n=1 Tax=Musca vetustissima TaxID=27455 RepID=UPI002AB7D3AB|nr:protein ref(2)P-like [Musca vetustissima]